MKALVCREFGVPGVSDPVLEMETLPDPKPGPNEVVVAVKAASANFPDLLMLDNKYQHRAQTPYVPGYEFSGVVIEVGANVTGISVGDFGVAVTRSGGFAERAVVEADRFWKLPSTIDARLAAAFPLAYGTSYHALKDRAMIRPGEKLLVLGAAGGVGLAGVQLGKLLGAYVVAVVASASKVQVCQRWGADEVIDSSEGDFRQLLKQSAGESGFDVVLDPVGGSLSEPALRSLGWNGRHLVIGFAGGEIPKIPLNLPLLKGCSIQGVAWDTYSRRFPDLGRKNINEMAAWIADGSLLPVIGATYPLMRARDALEDLRQRRIEGKAIVVPE